MVYKTSGLTPGDRDRLDDQRAESDILFAAKLKIRRERKAMRDALDAIEAELAKIRECKQAWRVVSKASGEARDVEICHRLPEVGAKVRVYQGEATLSDDADCLRRVSKFLGVKPGSLTLPEAVKWAGIVAQATPVSAKAVWTQKNGEWGRVLQRPLDTKRSICFEVRTPERLSEQESAPAKRKAPERCPVQDFMTRQEYRALVWSQNKYMQERAHKAFRAGFVVG
jgi:hypothetical protein